MKKGTEGTEGREGTHRAPLEARRRLLVAAAAAGASALVSACGFRGGAFEDDLVAFGSFNDWVSARLFSRRLAREYPVTARTPPQSFPAYFITRGGMPMLQDPAAWVLHVGGLVRRPVMLTLAQLQAMPRLTYTVKHHCVEGWTAIASWTGTPFAALAERVEPRREARYVHFRSFDSGYTNGWDLASAMHPQTLLAYGWNDRPLGPDHGAPLRLYSPTKLGYKLTKYLYSVEFTSRRPGGYWEDQGYPWFGGV